METQISVCRARAEATCELDINMHAVLDVDLCTKMRTHYVICVR